MPPPRSAGFSRYQTFIVWLLAFLQFGIILDFMIMSPLGAVIMPALAIGPKQFGLVVSAYAFSAGISGLATAGFADRFDRKKIVLFFYLGFLLGTLGCGLARTYPLLLLARIVTGLFGGVIGSVILAIATDLFPSNMRGRVMGRIQTAFAASQVLGLPIGLYLSNRWNWHVPFLALAALGALGAVAMAWRMEPVTAHLKVLPAHGPWMHLLRTLIRPHYVIAFITTALMTTGAYMLMPFGTAFIVNNLGLAPASLPTIYLVTGLSTMFVGPTVGKAADAFGVFPVFMLGTTLSMTLVLIYTHLGPTSLPLIILINALMFVGIFSRVIPYQALASTVPAETERGSFNAINASIQQLSGGVASVIAGHIVTLGADGKLRHFEVIGYVVVATALITLMLVRHLQRLPPGSSLPRKAGVPA